MEKTKQQALDDTAARYNAERELGREVMRVLRAGPLPVDIEQDWRRAKSYNEIVGIAGKLGLLDPEITP